MWSYTKHLKISQPCLWFEVHHHSLLITDAIFEEVNERWKIYDITKDCITADLGQEHGLIPAYKPPTGLGYFEFTQPTYVAVECSVILMDEVIRIYITQNHTRMRYTLTVNYYK